MTPGLHFELVHLVSQDERRRPGTRHQGERRRGGYEVRGEREFLVGSLEVKFILDILTCEKNEIRISYEDKELNSWQFIPSMRSGPVDRRGNALLLMNDLCKPPHI